MSGSQATEAISAGSFTVADASAQNTAGAVGIVAKGLYKQFRSAGRWRDLVHGRLWGPTVEVLRGLDLEVPAGTLHVLMGKNGAGKSTLMRILGGLVLPTSGQVEVGGKVALVLADERSFSYRLSGRDNLGFFAQLQGLGRKAARPRIDWALACVGLTDRAGRPFREYSSGMRQRLSIARGLLAEADVFLLDEPTRGLDPETAVLLRGFVAQELVATRKKTVLLATHDLHEVARLGSQVSILDGGRIVKQVSPEEATARYGGTSYGAAPAGASP